MEIAVDVEERKGLHQEIQEAAVRNRRISDEDSGDEWVDHSVMEDDMEKNQRTKETEGEESSCY